MNREYKYDVAFSLCKQDVQFARDLIAQLNSSIKVFFYENNQEELIAKSGPEAFGKTFNSEARIVVILSRKEWSESYYTDIERNAIIDRTSVRNEGYSFLMVIPMAPGETPPWYPSTRIYANPQLSSVEQLARFIEFKLVDEGGQIKQVTLEERYSHIQDKIEAKKRLIQLQSSDEALKGIQEELTALEKAFTNKIEFLKNDRISAIGYNAGPSEDMHMYLNMDHYLLEMAVVKPDILSRRVILPLDHTLHMHLCSFSGYNTRNGQPDDKKTIVAKQYKFLYNKNQIGWAEPFLYGKADQQQQALLFQNRNIESAAPKTDYYDLKDPIASEGLVDQWFQGLLTHARENISKYI
jgi:hypothetical protein